MLRWGHRRFAHRGRAHGLRVLAPLGLAVLAACGPTHTTERVFAGRSEVGPYIEPEAYAAFAEGVYLEGHGEPERALRAFQRAQSIDPESPGVAARVGALLCRTDLAAALDALETSGFARDYAPAWSARARCLHQHGKSGDALDAARQAVRLDPHDPAANLLIARLLREGAEPGRASAWLFAWLLSDPGASAFWRAISEEAALSGDAALSELAHGRRPAAAREETAAGPAEPDPEPPLELALRAARRGRPALALEQAERSLAANPLDADALVVALYAAALLEDEAVLTRLLRGARAVAPPSAEVAPLLAELLGYRVGDEAAERWRAATHRRPEAAPPIP